ncbi:excalibur calcium-binding domain-containing protein [Pseudarthrobacter sp. fls2-241-R2A-127]|uniref:excalibur calcium-binding domain-containing protein n=1 Tax=Pseudarthrobacter sp. fls2-241-R2A-127 TaxID=3040303 RepID=UPI0025560E27|nr:excalibur calcium-binding domain-containing protein [Pseudarthrobacter sp. fls2-241-R2A-127]
MKENIRPAAGRLNKTLALAVLTGLMLTGCGGGKQAAVEPASAATATATAEASVAVPGVVGLTLDKATDQLEKIGFKVEAKDTIDGKALGAAKNWQVLSQDPSNGTQAAKGSTVHLGVKSLEKIAAEKAAAEKAAADKAAADAAAAAAAKAAADKAAADKTAADQAAAAKAAADQAAAAAAQKAAQAPAPAPAAVPAAPAPAAYYANCTAAKAAGAAPLYRGQPGYRSALDRDGDGIACER